MGTKITEDTKVTINLAILVTVLISIIGGGFWLGSTITRFDDRISSIEKLETEHEQLWNSVHVNENSISEVELSLIEIKTDLKWIRTKLEDTDGN
jgi:hypothetical protein